MRDYRHNGENIMKKTLAYHDGFNAYFDGSDDIDCPSHYPLKEKDDWARGWEDARLKHCEANKRVPFWYDEV